VPHPPPAHRSQIQRYRSLIYREFNQKFLRKFVHKEYDHFEFTLPGGKKVKLLEETE
jgi:hypothetical protein